MKKCFCLTLALLLLTGCTGQTQPTEQTEPVQEGLYDENYPLEQQTGGAIRAYPLDISHYTAAYMMGSKVLLITTTGEALVLYGEDGIISAEGMIEGYRPDAASFEVSVKGVANYLPQTKEVVLLNPQLQQTNRFQLPEDIQGEPVISLESNEIFYCRGGEIRALNMANGVARLLKSHVVADQTLNGCYYDGKLLRCVAKDQEGNQRQLYLLSENGTTVSTDTGIYDFDTFQDRHFVRRLDNRIDQMIVGTMAGESQLLAVTTETADMVSPALAMNGAVSYQRQEDGVALSFHDFTSGQTTAQVKLPGMSEPVAMVADQKVVWILTEETPQEGEQVSRQVLLRWDVSKSMVQEPTAVMATLYTSQNPDTEGLTLCKEQAATLNDTYGVRVAIWEDAVKTTGDYKAVAEHQPAILTEMMTALEPALQQYPESFLRKTVKTGWVRINLVRAIESGEDWVQFWHKGDWYLMISSEADISQAFLEAMGHAIDSRVLGNSRKYDTWSELNPENFLYTTEAEGQTQDVAKYMDGEYRTFVNMESISSPNEDRRQMFMAAMTEGNEAVFASAPMQAKLRRMCEAIREAFDMTNRKELFRWEQYLNEPLVQIEDSNG